MYSRIDTRKQYARNNIQYFLNTDNLIFAAILGIQKLQKK